MSEKVTIKVERKKLHLPTIALRGLVVFPNNLVHFEVGREKSIAAVEWAMANNSNVFLVAQKSMDTTEPQQADLFSYGVVAEVKQVLRVSDELVKVLVEGKYRAKLTELDTTGDFLLSAVRSAPVRAAKPEEAVETEALLRALKTGFDEYLGMNPRLAKDVVFTIVSSDDPMFLTEYMPANLLFRYEDKQAVMNENTLNGRLQRLVEMLRRECQVMKIEKEIAEKVNESMDKNQRDYYLHEQLHIISDELGEGDDTHAEADEYRRRITGLHLAEDSEKKLLKEVDRLAKMQSSNQEGTVIRTYLDTCLDLPWNTMTVDEIRAFDPIGIIFTGGPQSVYAEGSPQVDPEIFRLGIPILGICYGCQLMAQYLGGEVTAGSPARRPNPRTKAPGLCPAKERETDI